MAPLARVCLLFVLLLAATGVATAETRTALVIGNGAYKAHRLLDNPTRDARLIATALKAAGFETVETRLDLGIAEFRQALRRFQGLATGADVGFVYFAGHGIEVAGANWLVPIDAELADDRDLEYEAIKVDLVLQSLSGARMRVLVIDACRDNPFGRGWRSATRSGPSAGLAKVEADDVLVLFAAAPGRTAADGSDGNSPFARALAKRLPERGVPIQLLGGNVRDDVLAATGGQQRPYVSASITGRPFFLVPADPVPVAPSKAAPAAPAPATSDAAREWQDVKDTTSIVVLEGYLARHKADPVYSALAADMLERLKRARATRASPLPAPLPRDTKRPAPLPLAGMDKTLRVEGLKVKLGDTLETVLAAYNVKAPPAQSGRTLTVRAPLDGLYFFFEQDNGLHQVRMDAPFAGSVEDLRIGDPLPKLLASLGQPYTLPWSFGDNQAYAYHHGPLVVRFDVDKAGKIATIMYFPASR